MLSTNTFNLGSYSAGILVENSPALLLLESFYLSEGFIVVVSMRNLFLWELKAEFVCGYERSFFPSICIKS